MSSQPQYSRLVAEHFERPRHSGRFAPATDVIEGRAGRAAQGAAFSLSARIAEDRIAALRFEAYGCPHCIAAGSWLTDRLVGASREDLLAWSWKEAARTLDVPAEKRGRLLILEDAIRALAAAWLHRT
jgi:nitrogen fixation protein NifU and related proteins